MELLQRSEVLEAMKTTVPNVVSEMTGLYLQAQDMKTRDEKKKWEDLVEEKVIPLYKKLQLLRNTADFGLDSGRRPFLSESSNDINAFILCEVQKQPDSQLAELALTWGRMAYGRHALQLKIKAYF